MAWNKNPWAKKPATTPSSTTKQTGVNSLLGSIKPRETFGASSQHRAKEAGAAADDAGYKASKEAKLKESAHSAHNWNTLFMRADAVGDAVAARYGVDKSELLSSDGATSAAVRLAQGQTHIM